MKLSINQKSELARLAMSSLPERLKDWPGFPENMVDKRTIGALERFGLVECLVHTWTPAVGGERRAIVYRLTEAGRRQFREVNPRNN